MVHRKDMHISSCFCFISQTLKWDAGCTAFSISPQYVTHCFLPTCYSLPKEVLWPWKSSQYRGIVLIAMVQKKCRKFVPTDGDVYLRKLSSLSSSFSCIEANISLCLVPTVRKLGKFNFWSLTFLGFRNCFSTLIVREPADCFAVALH